LETRKHSEPIYAWLTPNVALNFGYAIQASRDETHPVNDEGRRAAHKALQAFHELSAPIDSDDHVFLMRSRSIIVAFANALAHHKRAFAEELLAARAQFAVAQAEIHNEHRNEQKFEVVRKCFELLHMGIWGLIGYVLAHVLAPFIPSVIAEATGTLKPSLLFALVFGVSGGFIREAWFDHRRKRASERYDWHWRQVNYNYERRKLNEYHLHRKELRAMWEKYVGRKCEELPSYETLIESDLRTRQRMDRRLKDFSASELKLIASHLAELTTLPGHNGKDT
jgi:hypothetical protein